MNQSDTCFAGSATRAEPVALYLHIPYCPNRCTYCDFNAHVLPDEPEVAFRVYAEALIADIRAQKRRTVSSIFWGGGTPSLMPTPLLQEIALAVEEKFDFAPDLEHTIEVNPGTVTREQFVRYLKMGINRLSIGAQSFQAQHLQAVGRLHSARDIEKSFQDAREAGFDNISLDLIYGFPAQTLAQWRESLERTLRLSPEHLSIYQLTVEPSTRLEVQLRKKEVALPPEDDVVDMDELAAELLTAQGFLRYEVSNWSLHGRECRHNLRYWDDSEYLGLGCGAVSYLNGWRSERIKAPSYYQKALREGRSPVIFAERRCLDGALKDHLMMGLRVRGGVRWKDLESRYPGLTEDQLCLFFRRLPSTWWRHSSGRFELTQKGWDFHSDVAMELMNVMFSFL